jgi:uncharacterized membrane protein
VTRLFGLVLVAGFIVVLVIITVQLHGDAARSSLTQGHGLARQARVTSVHTVDHSTRTNSWVTYDYTVALSAPARSARVSVVHDPARDDQRFSSGDRVRVLVDPQQTGYAELPGLPVQAADWFIAPLIMTVVFLALAALIIVEHVRHRRRAGEGSGPAAAPA